MREIQIVKWCDNPLHEIEHNEKCPATVEHYVVLNRGKPHVVDLCATCEDAVIHPLQALLQVAVTVDQLPKSGNVRGPYKRKGGPEGGQPATGGQELVDSKCEYPGCDKGQAGTPFIARSRTGLGAHMHRSHGIALSDFESAQSAPEVEQT